MDKRELLNQLVAALTKDLEVLTQSALATYEGAIHEDSRAEDQYDTRGLEASYLAGAQSKRITELQDIIDLYRYIDLKKFGPQDKIAATALVALQSEGKKSYFLLMPKGGGLQTTFEGKLVQVVTPQSPIGEALLGKKCGDEIEVQIQRTVRDYEIIAVE